MSKNKSIDQLETELAKLEEMHAKARESYTGLSISYDENHEVIREAQKKVKNKYSNEYERRKNARNGMKNIAPTIKFMKAEMKSLRDEIRNREASGPKSLKRASGE
ncbi:MAG: hypothetical protein ABJI69_09115 [Balneola sp.]